jgi:hypothetical protein
MTREPDIITVWRLMVKAFGRLNIAVYHDLGGVVLVLFSIAAQLWVTRAAT